MRNFLALDLSSWIDQNATDNQIIQIISFRQTSYTAHLDSALNICRELEFETTELQRFTRDLQRHFAAC